MREDLGSLDTS